MDPSAPQTVTKGVLITSSVCGVAAALYGLFKGQSPGKLLLFSVVNSGIAAATFFSTREYVVGPALVLTHPGREYQLRRHKLVQTAGVVVHGEHTPTWDDIRKSRLIDSAVSGAFTGGILNAWKRGRPGLISGLGTGALMCTLLQWTINEFRIFRLSRLSQSLAAPIETAAPNTESDSTRPQPRARASPSAFKYTAFETASWSDSILSMLSRRISDEEYLRRLKAQRDAHLRRIEELEKELDQGRRM
ncbi:hypothetical protein F5I97DRAFT_566246 [Phlebopus sp. FC_14]|nr:hypothetical protein F5I97DRAFT_566246 [Phlebopus sp. FC_14]